MARKKRNGQDTENCGNNKTRSWPDLPTPVIISIRKQLDNLKHLYFGGVCKKWRAATRTCIKARPCPGLALSHHESSVKGNQLSFPLCKLYQPKGSKNPLKYCIGSSYGWLIMRELEPVREGEHCRLTVLDPIWGNRNGFWNEEFCNIIDPYATTELHYLQLTSAIAFKGKIYALSLQGTLVLLNPDSLPRVCITSVNRAIPSMPCRFFREFLLKCDEEILVIFLISRGTINRVDDIEVFQFDFGCSNWVKKKSLGDQVLFIGLSSSMSMSANQLRYKGNCIIFTQHVRDGWWIFSMEDGSISPS